MDESKQNAVGANGVSFCLGHPSHVLQPGQCLCRVCGALAANIEIGTYRLQKSLGVGRGGYAYLALHTTTRQPVCVKVTHPMQRNAQQWTLWEAARKEARSISSLRHPAILPVFSCSIWRSEGHRLEQMSSGTDHGGQGSSLTKDLNGDSFLVMLSQYVPGTLPYFVAYYQKTEKQQQLQDRGISLLRILLKLMMQIGSALQAVHSRGMTHGAVVPGNILLANYERCWLADFGSAKLYAPPVPYLPPELYTASNASAQPDSFHAYWQAVTPVSDQFMFAMLCQQVLSQILQQGEYQHILPILQRATQSRAEQRYGSIGQMLQDMEQLGNNAAWPIANQQRVPLIHPTTKSLQPRTGQSSSEGFAKPLTPVMGYTANLVPAAVMVPNVQMAIPETPRDYAVFLTPAVGRTPSGPQGVPLSAEDWEKLGDKCFTQRAYEEALKAYHRALEIVNNKAATWLALGDTYFALERHKEALMAYEQAMYLNPNEPQAWSSRGIVLDILGRHRDALESFERAEQLQANMTS